MINLPDDIQYLIWKSYFSHHILPNLIGRRISWLNDRCYDDTPTKIRDEIADQWYKDDCPPSKIIYEF